ncbi:MAG TPA: MOSC domain-containing protein [Solirubrobacteraceae bacterium]|nr:MOSC domain-containing protein [Solirubrobacteraceae bacterium]
MRYVRHRDPGQPRSIASFIACLASVLELDPAQLPGPAPGEDGPSGWTLTRWLGGLGIGLVAVSAPEAFTWPGPWIGRVGAGETERCVVMYGVPSGVIWDPAGDGEVPRAAVREGWVLAATDIALARPPLPPAPEAVGRLEAIWLAPAAGEPARAVPRVRALPGLGLEGDRHAVGQGTFPSGPPGSALTLIEAEVCASFAPPLGPDEHRRNLVTRGIALNQLVGHVFTIGPVRARGARLCEPCTVMQGYAGRAVLRDLVHRGGLRADILDAGEIAVGDEIGAVAGGTHAGRGTP